MLPTPLQKIEHPLTQSRKVHLYIKREDLNHPTIQGNKYRKLKYNLAKAKQEKKEKIVTFGGAFSNHIYAVAAAGEAYGFETVGVIRGERPAKLNPTLSYAASKGMTLDFVSRSAYRNKNDMEFQQYLASKFGEYYLIPEGGSNDLAVKGCTEIVSEIDMPYDYLCSAVGTGGTLSGLIVGNNNVSKVLGFPALKGGEFLYKDIGHLLGKKASDYNNWQLITDYHFGGYAKHNMELIDFMNQFKANYDISLDPIYTGKMLYGIFDLMKQGFFEKGSSIIAVHTGGLQGVSGFNQRFGDLLL